MKVQRATLIEVERLVRHESDVEAAVRFLRSTNHTIAQSVFYLSKVGFDLREASQLVIESAVWADVHDNMVDYASGALRAIDEIPDGSDE